MFISLIRSNIKLNDEPVIDYDRETLVFLINELRALKNYVVYNFILDSY